MKLKEAIAQRITTLMTERNLTVEGLSEATQLPVKTLQKILDCGYQRVGQEKVFIICYAMEIELSDFYKDAIFDPSNIQEAVK